MSFDKFESRIAARGEAQTPDAVAERARQPFVEAWNREVYPAWHGPLNKVKRVMGVARVGCGPSTSLSGMVGNLNELLAKLGRNDWSFVANVFVETSVGVGASVLYAFGGTLKAAALARVPVTDDGGRRVADLANVETWTGPLEKLETAAEGDVDEGAALLGAALDAALTARETREVEEEAARKAALEQAAADAKKAAEEAAKEAERQVAQAEAVRAEKAAELEEATKRVEALKSDASEAPAD